MVLASALCADAAEAQLREEMLMENSGFIMRPANTPQAMERLKILPPRKMVARTKNGQKTYIYADLDGCKCAMIGNEAALKNYRDMPRSVPQPDVVGRPAGPNRTELVIDDMSEEAFGNEFPGDIFSHQV